MKWLFVGIFLGFSFFGFSQHYLSSYFGEYTGMLYLYKANVLDSVPCSLKIQNTPDPNRINTLLSYYLPNGLQQDKNYDCIVDTNFHDNLHFLIDEKDGILIKETRIGNSFYSSYTVQDNFYTVHTSYFADHIDFELIVYNQTDKLETFSAPNAANNRYRIETFPLITVQKGKLIKKK